MIIKIIDDIIFNDDEADDDNFFSLVAMSCIAAIIAKNEPKHHSSFYVYDQMEWFSHVEELNNEGDEHFIRMYRMSLESFNSLCEILGPKLQVDAEMSILHTSKGVITMEMMLHCLLHWLSGGCYLDI